MNWRCLIIDPMHASIVQLLETEGIEVTYLPNIKKEAVAEALKEKEVLILRSKTTVDQSLLAHAAQLKFVLRAGAGIEKVDLDYIKSKGIELLNAPEGNRDALGEHAVALLLAVLNNIIKSNQEVNQGIWDREGNRGIELMRKKVGLIGYGHMGFAFASRIKAFGCKIFAYDKYKTGFSDAYVTEAELNTISEECDIVSLHIPLTDETKNFINTDFIRSFKKPFYLINTARGEVLDQQALLEGLQSGKILGAGLDVLNNEKLKTHSEVEKKQLNYLSTHPNVVLTPHVGGWSFESYIRINEVLVKKLKNKIQELKNIS